MNDVTVRPIRDSEIVRAVELIIGSSYSPEAESTGDEAAYLEAVRETRSRRGEVFVAVVNDEVVGVCQLLTFQHFQHRGGWCAEIESVHVDERMRSKGVGAAMLRTAEHFASARGCYRIQLTSNNLRNDAHRFYETNGYVRSHQGFKKSLATS